MDSVELLKLLDVFNKLDHKIDSLKQPQKSIEPNKSEKLKELFTALAKAQGEMKSAQTTSENPYFKSKYAGLNEIIKASRPALSKYGLSVLQPIVPNDVGQNILHTILSHSSGEWIESRMKIIPLKSDVQSLGSYITYLRRYAYASLVGITTAGEDDDGEYAMATQRDLYAKGTALNTKYNPKENKFETISKDQIKEAEYELSEYPDIAEQILDGFKIQSLADMPKDKFPAAIRRVREIKNLRNGK